MDDARILHEDFGSDSAMYEYSGWNPYETVEAATEAVKGFIEGYAKPDFYGWAIECDGLVVGTIGAYDHDPRQGSIEVGLSIKRSCWGRGYATEALVAVIDHLRNHEGIGTVTAWCASENIGSKKALLKAGMQISGIEKDALKIGGRVYDKLNFRL